MDHSYGCMPPNFKSAGSNNCSETCSLCSYMNRAGQGGAGRGRAGQGRTGKGREGQGRAGKGREGQGRAGQGREGKGRAGQGRTGKDREGQGRAGQGRAGQGRAGQGRAGEGKDEAVPEWPFWRCGFTIFLRPCSFISGYTYFKLVQSSIDYIGWPCLAGQCSVAWTGYQCTSVPIL